MSGFPQVYQPSHYSRGETRPDECQGKLAGLFWPSEFLLAPRAIVRPAHDGMLRPGFHAAPPELRGSLHQQRHHGHRRAHSCLSRGIQRRE